MSNRESRSASHPNIQIDDCLGSLEMTVKREHDNLEHENMEFSETQSVPLVFSGKGRRDQTAPRQSSFGAFLTL